MDHKPLSLSISPTTLEFANRWFEKIADGEHRHLREMVGNKETTIWHLCVGRENVLTDRKSIGAFAITMIAIEKRHWIEINALAANAVKGMDVTGEIFAKLVKLGQILKVAGIVTKTRRSGLKRKLERLGATSRPCKGEPGRFEIKIRTDHVHI